MAHTFTLTRRVEFSETDLAGIVHFSNFFRYMEATEHAFFRSLGFSIHPPDASIGWPRVGATCDYRAPLRFEDTFTCTLTVTAKKSKSLSYRFDFRRLDDPTILATGSLTAVCVRFDTDAGRMRATTIPDDIAAAIEVEGDWDGQGE